MNRPRPAAAPGAAGPRARVGEGVGRHACEDSVEAVRAAEASQQVAALTQREREILALIALGLTNQEICDREWLSMPTVKTHVSHLRAKLRALDPDVEYIETVWGLGYRLAAL